MSDNTELIAEAKNYEGDNGTARWPALIRELADALEATERIMNGYDRTPAEARAHAAEAERDALTEQLAAAQAVIAEALVDAQKCPAGCCESILAQSHTDALEARDNRVAAKALTTYAEALEENPSAEAWGHGDFVADARDWAAHIEEGTLIARAAAIVSEPSPPEGGTP